MRKNVPGEKMKKYMGKGKVFDNDKVPGKKKELRRAVGVCANRRRPYDSISLRRLLIFQL